MQDRRQSEEMINAKSLWCGPTSRAGHP
jgi:hypothetical protein